MKSVLVIGMGKFGMILSTKMLELGNEVMIVDKDETIINELAPDFTHSYVGNCTNKSVLECLGVNNFDICFVTVGEDFQSSLEITSLLKELGAKYVISKAKRDIQAKFLLRNGADEIVYPERDVALKLAIRCDAKNIFDFIEFNEQFAIFEIGTPIQWVGKNLGEINVRRKLGINVLAVKRNGKFDPLLTPETVFEKNDHVIIMGKPNEVIKLTTAKK